MDSTSLIERDVTTINAASRCHVRSFQRPGRLTSPQRTDHVTHMQMPRKHNYPAHACFSFEKRATPPSSSKTTLVRDFFFLLPSCECVQTERGMQSLQLFFQSVSTTVRLISSVLSRLECSSANGPLHACRPFLLAPSSSTRRRRGGLTPSPPLLSLSLPYINEHA